jgi:hypothetical protein
MSIGAVLAVAAATLATVPASAAASASGAIAPGGARGHAQARWVNAWQGSPVPGGTIPGPAFNCPADKGVNNQTVRNIVFLTAGGDRVRVRLTNAFGARPLRVGAASVAIAGTAPRRFPGPAGRCASPAGHRS